MVMPRSLNQRAAATACSSSRADLVALEVEAAAHHRLHVVGGDDAQGLDPEVGVAVAVRHRLTGDLEHELVALARDEAELLDLALEELVGGDGGAVADGGDVGAGGAEHAEDLVHAVDEPVRRVARGGGVLVVRSSRKSSSKATTSVNVPPVSMPILMRRGCVVPADMGAPRWWVSRSSDSTGAGATFRWHNLPTDHPDGPTLTTCLQVPEPQPSPNRPRASCGMRGFSARTLSCCRPGVAVRVAEPEERSAVNARRGTGDLAALHAAADQLLAGGCGVAQRRAGPRIGQAHRWDGRLPTTIEQPDPCGQAGRRPCSLTVWWSRLKPTWSR